MSNPLALEYMVLSAESETYSSTDFDPSFWPCKCPQEELLTNVSDISAIIYSSIYVSQSWDFWALQNYLVYCNGIFLWDYDINK